MFEKQLVAGWGDMDFNSHMRNTAFLDKSADIRMMIFSENGFPMEEFISRVLTPPGKRAIMKATGGRFRTAGWSQYA